MSIDKKLREIRKTHGLTQEQLANRIFVSRSMIAKYETGKAVPTEEVLEKISEEFSVPLAELLEKDEESSNEKMHRSPLSASGKILIICAVLLFLLVVQYILCTTVTVNKTCDEIQEVWVEYDEEWARWNVTPRENQSFVGGICHIYIAPYTEGKYEFTIDGQSFSGILPELNATGENPLHELTSATLYYKIYTKTNLYGQVIDLKYDFLGKVDFHLEK